jgi:membrane protein implicated in regulation of membrane protease activity
MVWATWWAWWILALLLALLELAAPGYILLGFAAGAAATGLLLLAGGPLAAWLSAAFPALLLAFALLSLAAWIAIRRAAGLRKGQIRVFDHDVNED